jgi:hypothetical protein
MDLDRLIAAKFEHTGTWRHDEDKQALSEAPRPAAKPNLGGGDVTLPPFPPFLRRDARRRQPNLIRGGMASTGIGPPTEAARPAVPPLGRSPIGFACLPLTGWRKPQSSRQRTDFS